MAKSDQNQIHHILSFFFLFLIWAIFQIFLSIKMFDSSCISHISTHNPVTNPTSVYYIHPNENPTVSLVSEKFNGDNFADWKRGMILALSIKNKIPFIDGSLTKSEVTDPLLKAWERCNNMIISYLLRSLDNTIAKSVLYFSTGYEIWKDLEDRYSVISGPQLYSLQQNLSKINQGDSSVCSSCLP